MDTMGFTQRNNVMYNMLNLQIDKNFSWTMFHKVCKSFLTQQLTKLRYSLILRKSGKFLQRQKEVAFNGYCLLYLEN